MSIVKREDGMIEPTILGCSRNPRKNTPHWPKNRAVFWPKLSRRRIANSLGVVKAKRALDCRPAGAGCKRAALAVS